MRISDWSSDVCSSDLAEARLTRWAFHPNGTEGFAKAEVTIGGIATAGLSSQTMMAQSVAGLYAVGEAVAVTGWLGGDNFQWAWAIGTAAGQALFVKTQHGRPSIRARGL